MKIIGIPKCIRKVSALYFTDLCIPNHCVSKSENRPIYRGSPILYDLEEPFYYLRPEGQVYSGATRIIEILWASDIP